MPAILRFAWAGRGVSVALMAWFRCISSLGCPDLSLAETLALAARHGIPAVELRTLGGGVDLADYLRRTCGTPAGFAAQVRSSPVRVIALNASLPLVGATADHRGEVEALAEWANGAGVPWIRVFDGGKLADPTELAAATATLRGWRTLRAQRGWRTDLMVETHDSLLTAARLQRFLALVPDAAVLWDAHHTWRKGGEDPVATWRAIRGHVAHVHVKDSIDRPSARHPFTYVLPGDGEFPIAPLLAALRADGYANGLSLEWEKQWHPYLPPLDEALRVAAARQWW